MKSIDELPLMISERNALSELKKRLMESFDIKSITLFGSVSRSESDNTSDIDLLILTSHPIEKLKRHEITDIVFEINLKFNTNFSTLVLDENNWENGPYSVLSIKQEIIQDGVPL